MTSQAWGLQREGHRGEQVASDTEKSRFVLEVLLCREPWEMGAGGDSRTPVEVHDRVREEQWARLGAATC